MGRGRRIAPVIVAGALLTALLSACGEASQPLEANDVVSTIPWPESETATYRVTQDDIEGECVFTIEQGEPGVSLMQACEGEGFTDTVTVVADAESLRPRSTTRTITGPEGEVTCEATYEGFTVDVTWISPDDERQNELDVPQVSYDSWADVFLWRTVRFGEGYDQNYVDVASCTNPRARPELVGVRIIATEVEEVEVPLGAYEAWHLEIKAEGVTQHAWYSTDEDRVLVKYDNGDQVFELVSLEG